jgi:Lon protease-like protein
VLRGVERFRILEEDAAKSYRRAIVESVPEGAGTGDDHAALRRQRTKLESLLAPAIERSLSGSGRLESIGGGGRDPKIPPTMADEDLVNALAQYLDLEPLEKQALLEQQSLRSRAESLVELLEMKILIARTPGVSNVAH